MTLTMQLTVFALMWGMGLLLGLWFDLYRFVNRRRTPLAPLLDLIFWAGVTGSTLVVLMAVNHLELRLYVFISMGLGFFAYLKILSALILKVYEKVFSLLVLCLRFLLVISKPLTVPLRLAGALTDNLALVMINAAAWLTLKLNFRYFQQENQPPM